MLKAKEVISYYEDGTKVSVYTTDKIHKTTIEKDGQKSTIEITVEGIKTEVSSISQRVDQIEIKIDGEGLVRVPRLSYGESKTKMIFNDETIKEIIKGINRVQNSEGGTI